MGASFTDHFGSVSGAYAHYRPTYPAALFDWLAAVAPARQRAWDCATGTGQAAIGLAAHFAEVVATDASASQLAAARPAPGVHYRLAAAEGSGLEADSVDLVTVAQALHWFDQPRFFREVERVLRPGGVLAVWSYGIPELEGEGPDALLQHFYADIVGPYWPPENAQVENGYRDLVLPFECLEAPALRHGSHLDPGAAARLRLQLVGQRPLPGRPGPRPHRTAASAPGGRLGGGGDTTAPALAADDQGVATGLGVGVAESA